MTMCESPMDRDAPVMLAWATFKATEAYENAARWAVSPQDTEGSLWRAFLEGYEAAGRARGRAPRPAQDAVREAAEVVRTILTAHDARLSESGVLTYGPPSKGTGFVAAIQWLRRYDAARGGE